MKTRQYIILGVCAGLILFGSIATMNYLGSQKAPQAKRPPQTTETKVTATPMTYSDQETELEYFGRVNNFSSVELIAEVQGKILAGAAALKPGQNIRKGQLLFRIDDREARLSLQAQKSLFQKALADILADIKVDFPDRFPTWEGYFRSLNPEENLADLPAVENLKEKTFLSTRSIFSSYYNIRAQEERLRKYRVYAPFSGSLSQVALESGSVANPGSRIATLVRTDRLELVIPVSAGDLKWLKSGTKIDVSSQDGLESYNATISRIGELVDANTQSVNVYATLNSNNENPLIAGQYLKAVLPGTVVRKAMTLPRRALFDEKYVYTVVDGKLKRKEVVVHKLNPTTAIVSGPAEGSSVVTEVPLNAVENLEVKVVAP